MTIFICLLLIGISIVLFSNISMQNLMRSTVRSALRLQYLARQLQEQQQGLTRVEDAVNPVEAVMMRTRTPYLRIRANYAQRPPSLRPGYTTAEDPGEFHFTSNYSAVRSDYHQLGELTDRKMEDGHRIVVRPDGREKRYFEMADFQEATTTGKRDASLPTLDLLDDSTFETPSAEDINRNVVLIENTLLEFDVDIDVVEVEVGPTTTRYAVQPFQIRNDGTLERQRLSAIASREKDLTLALSTRQLRLESPIPGTQHMGIEVPNKVRSTVSLRNVYQSRSFSDFKKKSDSPLAIPMGRDVSGKPVNVDLARLPHLLVAGATGSGKSVCLTSIATALIMDNTPQYVRLIMLDPKEGRADTLQRHPPSDGAGRDQHRTHSRYPQVVYPGDGSTLPCAGSQHRA